MVPRNPLLLITALLVVPLLGVATAASQPLALLVVLAIGVVVSWDGFASRSLLDGFVVESAGLVRLAKGREDRISLFLRHPTVAIQNLRVGLAFTPQLGACQDIQEVQVSGLSERQSVEFLCRPRETGSFLLDTCFLEAPSRWGFWARRKAVPLSLELRVYLDLMRERQVMAVLFLNRESLGIHAQRQVGQGRDFEKLRRYIGGDSLSDIHWKATAKRGFLVTKQFRVERTQEVYVVVDGSRLSARSAVPEHYLSRMAQDEEVTVLERYLTAAMLLGLAAEKQGDLFGVVGFADKVQSFVRAKAGRSHFSSCRDALFGMRPLPVSPDPEELFSFLRQRLQRRALLIVLTHLDDPLTAESFIANIGLLSRRHLVLVAMIKDRHMRPIFSGGPVQNEAEIYEALGAHLRWRDLKEVGSVLHRKGVQFSLLDNEGLCLSLLTQYVNIKQRQLL